MPVTSIMQLLHAFFSARGNIVRIDSCTDDSIRISLTVAIRLIGAPVNRYTPNHKYISRLHWVKCVTEYLWNLSVRSVTPTVLVGSISYLYILSSNLRRCVACIFGNFLKFVTLTLSCFDLGSDCESLVWVIMGQRRVSQNAGILVVLVECFWKPLFVTSLWPNLTISCDTGSTYIDDWICL